MDERSGSGMTVSELENVIVVHASSKPNRVWFIGISNDAKGVLADLIARSVDVASWQSWPAASLNAALEAERYFVRKGYMCGGAEHAKFAKLCHVYMY